MAFVLTNDAEASASKNQIFPQLVLEIDGVATRYGVLPIKRYWRIGDEDVFIGDVGLTIGGQINIPNQESIISFQQGTSTEISQTLNVDKGTNESVSTMKVALIDRGEKVTRLITPGEIVTDILGRKCKLWLGFDDVSFKDDFVIIFRGIIESVDSGAGIVSLNIVSPDSKKKTAIFPKATAELNGAINNSVTTITVDQTNDFLTSYTPASGVPDTNIKFYVRIDDEVMQYTGKTGTTFTGLTRGALNTTAATHDDGASVESFYIIDGNPIDIALKMMMSGVNGPYVTNVAVDNFVRIDISTVVSNSIFFSNTVFNQEYNPIVGDYITTTGATNAANNVTNKQILEVTQVTGGWYIVVDGVTFVEEVGSDAVISFRSQYDVWGSNAGMKLGNDEVDVSEHLKIKANYLSSAQYRFYLKDTIDNGQEFLGEQVYNPLSTFAIPRNAQSSVGIHQGPIPGSNIKTLDITNVVNASKIKIQRSISKNFFNSVIYKFEERVLEDTYSKGTVKIDGTSISQIPIGNKPLIIESKGLRDVFSATNLAQAASTRRLRKYKFGAEFIKGLEVNFKTGFDLEVGDKVILDLESLKISDVNTANRSGEPRLFQIDNKKLSINTGKISLDLVDTNYSLDTRYCLIGPSSFVASGISQSQFIIKPSYNTSVYGTSEYKKWTKYIGAYVVVRSPDYSVSGFSYIEEITGNTITLSSNLGFTPLANYIMELDDYDNQPANVKLVYGFMSDGSNNFSDGKIPYQQS